MRTIPESLRQPLAAEYVLGTLHGRARARFEALMRNDPATQEAVRQWENFSLPLLARTPPVEPPARVWSAIEARLGPRAPAAAVTSIWSSLAFWRFAGAALAVIVGALLLQLASLKPPPPGPTLVAVLSAQDQVARIVVERHDAMLRLRMVKPWPQRPNQEFELWVVPKDGPPRSLGVIAGNRDAEIRHPDLETRLLDGVSFALSREPAGGSPTGQPTSVVCTGAIARSGKI
jgi:anti-sigma-K factor RskA